MKQIFLIIAIFFSNCLLAQKSKEILQLEDSLRYFNKNNELEKSVSITNKFIDNNYHKYENVCNAYLILSQTYKRIFDYDNVLRFLDSALFYASKIESNPNYYIDNICCQKALALFDIHKYEQSDKLIEEIENKHYRNLDNGDKAYIIMQRGYLLQLSKNYKQAEIKYDEAIKVMKLISPCNLPVIYGKKIFLYGLLNQEKKIKESYNLSIRYADSCQILKYNLYAAEMMRKTYHEALNDYKNAYHYFWIYDSINLLYKADDTKNKIEELNVKYESQKKEQAIQLQEKELLANDRLIALLIIGIVGLIILIALIITVYRRNKVIDEKKQSQLFTKQLFEKTEEERKRIATDLHDSVNNELLLIRSSVEANNKDSTSKIDDLISSVRSLSRNLQPVMFEEIGLKESTEQLAERIQQYNKFVLNTEIEEIDDLLSTSDALQVYRIIQEAITNMLKHSRAEAGYISIHQEEKNLVINIKDNGTGFNAEETLSAKKTFGLNNILERSHAIGGVVNINSGKGGTYINIVINLK